MATSEFEPLPGPPGLPIIGNLNDIDGENPTLSFSRLTDIYGPSDPRLYTALEYVVLTHRRTNLEIPHSRRPYRDCIASINERDQQ